MNQSAVLIVFLVLLLACLPWAVNRLKRRLGVTAPGTSHEGRVLSVLAVGQQQRVVTVEVGPPGARVTLVLGVTAQSVNCLHTVPHSGTELAAP